MRDYPTRDIFAADYPNVLGTAFGEDQTLIVLVTKKVAEDDLDVDDIVPTTVVIDGEAFVTDVYPVGIPHRHDVPMSQTEPSEHQDRHRPIPGGVSVGNDSVGAGTIGSPLLTHAESGDPVVLSNSHVFGGATEQFQPAAMDGGAENEPIGTLREASDLDPSTDQRTDSALVDVDPEQFTSRILGIGELVGFDDTAATFDKVYKKAGRTTGVTSGELRGTDASVRVAYGPDTLQFRGVDVFTDMSKPGDSGSLIGHMDGDGFHATHLLFAGSDQATIAIPLENVQEFHGDLEIPGTEDDNGGDRSKDWSFAPFRYQARVAGTEAVVDGDTVDIQAVDLGFGINKVDKRIRVADIDTAERGEEDYDTHTEFVEDWLLAAFKDYDGGTGDPDGEWPLILETRSDETDSFGRWLGDLWRRSDGLSLACSVHDEFGDDVLYETVDAPATSHLGR